MRNDFRALCAELTEFVARLTKHYYEPAELLTRARAALADEPAVPEPATWTEGVCGDEAALLKDGVMVPIETVVRELNEGARARAILARWGNPAPQPPGDGEVAELVALLRAEAKDDMLILNPADLLRAADLLQRLSPPQPVPGQEVSE